MPSTPPTSVVLTWVSREGRDGIAVDNGKAGSMIADHLLGLGHRSFGIVKARRNRHSGNRGTHLAGADDHRPPIWPDGPSRGRARPGSAGQAGRAPRDPPRHRSRGARLRWSSPRIEGWGGEWAWSSVTTRVASRRSRSEPLEGQVRRPARDPQFMRRPVPSWRGKGFQGSCERRLALMLSRNGDRGLPR